MSKKNSSGKDAVDFLNEASDLMDRDKYRDAAGLLTEAIGLCGHPRLYFNRGYCYHQLKDSKNAIRDFSKSIVNDRGNDLLEHEKQRLYLYIGIIHEDTDEDKAIEAYKKAADWGYKGAIAKLEKLGIDYVPQDPLAKPSEPEEKPAAKTATVKIKTALKSPSASAASLIPPKKKSRFKFILPVVIGLICGVGAYFILNNLPKIDMGKSAIKTREVTATVISDTLYLYAEPYLFADTLKVLYKGFIVEITGDASGGFTPVEHEGVKGWVDSNSID
ncbi:MAG: hypothetical protein FWC19_10155 [Treponema sp.]|nr:hypothetical protein [Treponema sp.]MCL2273150.1 hypothetical protein [Treponema sp.]